MLKNVSAVGGVRGIIRHSSAEESDVTLSLTHSEPLLGSSSSDAGGLGGGEGGHTYFSTMSAPPDSCVSLGSGGAAWGTNRHLFTLDKTTESGSAFSASSERVHATVSSYGP